MSDRIRERWCEWRESEVLACGVVRWLLVGLAVWLLAMVVYLVMGEKPWSEEVLGLAEGSSAKRVEFHMRTGLWWAAVVNLGIAVVALVTVRWWGVMVPTGSTIETCRRVYSPWARRLMILGLAGAVVVGVFERLPRMTHGFWNDEEYAFRRFVSGYHRDDGTGGLEFKKVRWMDSLFMNHDGNNHVWHTVEARAGLGVWRLVTGAGEDEFEEWPVRMGPFLSGLGSIVLVGLLGSLLGRPLAGVMGAWFLALSPWHMRYAVEARGYASMIFFVMLGIIFLIRALETGRWRWWLSYGGAQCLMLWCFAGVVYVAVVQNVCALLFLLMNARWAGSRQGVVGRFVVANAMSAGVFLVLMVPSLLQLAAFLEGYQAETGRANLGAAFLCDVWSHLVAGVPWGVGEGGSNEWVSMGTLKAGSFGAFAFLNVVMPAVAVLGAGLMLLRGDWRTRLVVLILVGAAFCMWLHNAMTGTEIMGWYFVFLAPGFALLLGWGAAPTWVESFWVRSGTAGLLVGLYWVSAGGPREVIRERERHPMREVVEKVRGVSPAVTASDRGVITAAMGSGNRQLRTYDPWVRPIETGEELKELVTEAREGGKELAVYVCSPFRVEREAPEAWAMLENEKVFREGEVVPGLEEFWSFEVRWLRE